MIEALKDFLVFASGVIGAMLALMWRHRKVVAAVVEWAIKAFEDGKISKNELKELLAILGEKL